MQGDQRPFPGAWRRSNSHEEWKNVAKALKTCQIVFRRRIRQRRATEPCPRTVVTNVMIHGDAVAVSCNSLPAFEHFFGGYLSRIHSGLLD